MFNRDAKQGIHFIILDLNFSCNIVQLIMTSISQISTITSPVEVCPEK